MKVFDLFRLTFLMGLLASFCLALAVLADDNENSVFRVQGSSSFEDFSDNFVEADFQNISFDELLAKTLTGSLGIPYFRLVSIPPPGSNQAVFRADIEGISLAQRLQSLRGLLQRVPPKQVHWENLFMVWPSLFPNSNQANVGRIRDLAIFLQNIDTQGRWGYARLRQRVHNFPDPSLVDDLTNEWKAAQEELDSAPNDNVQADRVNWLKELAELEHRFWFGDGLSRDELMEGLHQFGLEAEQEKLLFAASNSPLAKIIKLVELQKTLRLRVGSRRHRSVENLMSSNEVLSGDESMILVALLHFDRRINSEVMRLLAQLKVVDVRSQALDLVKVIARALDLEAFLSESQVHELEALSSRTESNVIGLRRILVQIIGLLQGRFAAAQDLIARARQPGNFLESFDAIGPAERIADLGQAEVRQSILFSSAGLLVALNRDYHEPPRLCLRGVCREVNDMEVISPIRRPLDGEVILIRKPEDLINAHKMVTAGHKIILVKMIEYDIDLPPVELLVTMDPTLNEASHMALLAQSAGIPHFNILEPQGEMAHFLKEMADEELRIWLDPGAKGAIQFAHMKKDLRETNENDRGVNAKFTINLLLDETVDHPVRLEQMVDLAESLGQPVSGGKGRGLAQLLNLQKIESARRRVDLGIPNSVQLPYGWFLKWLREVDLLEKWNRAIESNPISANWSVIEEAMSAPIPAPLLKELIDDYLGGNKGLAEGWFVRSNSNSEDGGFNAAGVNKTIADISDRGSLEAAIKEVFLTTYKPKARTWWSKVYTNPQQVRSTVLLVKTIVSEKASVVLVDSEGSRFSVDSLPGLGENVVGATGGFAERLLFSLETDRQGEGSYRVSDIVTIQPALANRLQLWVVDEYGKRRIENRNTFYSGSVLSEVERKNLTDLVMQVRKMVDLNADYANKPLDLEIAWKNHRPHLVQLRMAPDSPPMPDQRNLGSSRRPLWEGFIANLSVRSDQESDGNGDTSDKSFLPKNVIQRLVQELKTSSRFSMNHRVSVAMLTSFFQLSGRPTPEDIAERNRRWEQEGGQKLLESLRGAMLKILSQVSTQDMNLALASNQMAALLDAYSTLVREIERLSAGEIVHPFQEGDSGSQEIMKFLLDCLGRSESPAENVTFIIERFLSLSAPERNRGSTEASLIAAVGTQNLLRFAEGVNGFRRIRDFSDAMVKFLIEEIRDSHRLETSISAHEVLLTLTKAYPLILESFENRIDWYMLRVGRMSSLDLEWMEFLDPIRSQLGLLSRDKKIITQEILSLSAPEFTFLLKAKSILWNELLRREREKLPSDRDLDRLLALAGGNDEGKNQKEEIYQLIQEIPSLVANVKTNEGNKWDEIQLCTNGTCILVSYEEFMERFSSHCVRIYFDLSQSQLRKVSLEDNLIAQQAVVNEIGIGFIEISRTYLDNRMRTATMDNYQLAAQKMKDLLAKYEDVQIPLPLDMWLYILRQANNFSRLSGEQLYAWLSNCIPVNISIELELEGKRSYLVFVDTASLFRVKLAKSSKRIPQLEWTIETSKGEISGTEVNFGSSLFFGSDERGRGDASPTQKQLVLKILRGLDNTPDKLVTRTLGLPLLTSACYQNLIDQAMREIF